VLLLTFVRHLTRTASSTPENYPRKICHRRTCVLLYPISDGSAKFGARTGHVANLSYGDWKDRFIIVDVGGETVVIDVAVPTDKFDAFLPKAQKVLDTVEWKGG